MVQRLKTFFFKYSKYVVLALLMYMPIFGNLNTLPIRIWDEARIAVSAYEMHFTGNFLVTTFNWEPDMWNTKPPFLVWCMVFLMKTIGVNELAVRLPSAFAAFFTCLALLLFLRRYFKDAWLGIISVLVLITTNGYIHYHVSRTGDYDCLLTLFTTVSCLYFYTFSETKKIKYLYLFFITLTLAVLTKGVAGLLFTPAMLLFCLLQKQLKLFVFNKHFYIGLLIFLVFGVGFYFLRDHYNPGYISAIQENELGGRYLKSQGDQPFDFWFYYNNLFDKQLSAWFLLIPCGLFAGWLSKNARMKRFMLFITLLTFSFFIIVSAGQTRLEQYIAPLFPFFAVIVAIFLHYVFRAVYTFEYTMQRLSVNILPVIFLLLVFYTPYRKIWEKTYSVKEDYWWDDKIYEIGYFLKSAVGGHHDLNGKYLIYEGYNAHNLFYVYALQDIGVKTLMRFAPDIKPGEQLIVCQESVGKMLQENYIVATEKLSDQIYFFQIIGPKTKSTDLEK